MELFEKPAVAGIIEKVIDGDIYILIQERHKKDAPNERGMMEIPAGKVREFENVFDCLRREINEETGLEVVEINGENDSIIYKSNNYKVISYTPFANTQNISGSYPIMVQTFICQVKGNLLPESDESRNIRWIELKNLNMLINKDEKSFYPMHINILKKYIKMKMS